MTRDGNMMGRAGGILLVSVLACGWLPASTGAQDTNNAVATLVDTNAVRFADTHAEQVRATCLQGRRYICGKVLKVLPDGLVVECGYTNLMRAPLNQSWLVPGIVSVGGGTNLVEGEAPGSVCVGLIFLTDIPKSRSLKPKPFDYVVIEGYPAGVHTYQSVGDLRRTVRRFSVGLPTAVDLCLQAEKQAQPAEAR